MPLTNAQVKNAKPANKTYRLFDGGGLYLEVSPKGGKWWRHKYRFDGKEKRVSLGVYPDVPLKEARIRHSDARKLLANGVDPSAHRKVTRAVRKEQLSNSFETIGREWYAKNAHGWADSHGDRVLRRLERDVFPWLGNKPMVDITAADILTTVQRIEARGAIDTARRALQNCGQIFRYAVATGRAERDPTGDLKGALPPKSGRHFAAVTDPQRLGELLQIFDGYTGTLTVRCALRLAPLVFVRPGELRHAEWKDIDFEKAEWRFTASKNGPQHIVPLSRQAVAILNELKPLTGRGRYVFPSARTPRGDRPMSENAVLAAMRRMEISKDEMSGHGFRAAARTILDEELGFRPDFIEHQLAHAVRDPNGRAYNRTAHLAERRKMMQAWADYLDQLKKASRLTPSA
jgi:integrase